MGMNYFNQAQPLVNMGTSNAFAAQDNMAQQQLEMSDEQFKNIRSLYNPKESLAYQQAGATAAGNVPSLKFGGNDFAEGLGNGINNYYAMRGYNTQQQAYKDLATQQQAYQQKQAMDYRTQLQNEQNRRQGGGQKLPEPLRPIFQTLGPAEQDKYLYDYSSKELGLNTKPRELEIENAAKLQAQAAERAAKEKQFFEMSGMTVAKFMELANSKQLTPQLKNIYNYTIGGPAPTDLVDYQERDAGLKTKQADLYKKETDNDVLPQMNAADLDSKLIANQTAQIQQALKQLELNTAPEKLAAEAEARQWTAEERVRKTAEAEKIRQITFGVTALMDQGKLTPQDLVTAQTQLQLLHSNALDPIVSGFQSVGKSNKATKLETATKQANAGAAERDKQMQSQGFQKSPSGRWYNPTTREWR